MTEGNGHLIDPNGEARRALHEAVAEHGPEALSNAVIMDNVRRDHLIGLPGESILISSATRTDVPALLRDLIPRLGNYGAIQSAAATLAKEHELDMAACLWVVREFARALGHIAPGPASETPGSETPGGAAAASADAGSESEGGAGGGGAGLPGGPGLPPQGPGGAGASTPGGPPGPPGRPPERSRVFNRNTLGVAAAIALVAGYLGVAAVAHLSPFPAKTVAATSTQSPGTGTSAGTSTSPSPNGSPDASPDPSPTSDYQFLLTKIPSAVRGQNNCHNAGTEVGATAVSQCAGPHGLAAGTIVYYLFTSPAKLATGFSALLKTAKFNRSRECTTNNKFTDFLTECESDFTSATPNVKGSIAEYVNTSNQPIIVSSDSRQNVMAVMVGTNDGDLLAYWKQLNWVVP